MARFSGQHIEVSSRASAAATRVAGVVIALLLSAAWACGGGNVATDPLASIAESVPEDERAPAPLTEVWRREPATPLTLRPAVGGSNVYLAMEARLAAWSAEDGSTRWAPIDLDSGISAPPAALGQQVVVATRGGSSGAPRMWWFSDTGTLVAQETVDAPVREISAEPGTVMFIDEQGVGRRGGGLAWHEPVEDAATIELGPDLLLAVVTTTDGRVLAFATRDGALRWQYDAGARVSRVRISDQRVFFGTGAGDVLALSDDDGGVVWRRELGTAVLGAPALAQDLLWVAGLDARLRAFNAGNGTEMSPFNVALSSRNYLDIAAWEPWVIVGATYGPWLAVRAPMRFETTQRATQVSVRQANTPGHPDLALAAGSGPAGVAVVNWDGTVVFLQPQRAR